MQAVRDDAITTIGIMPPMHSASSFLFISLLYCESLLLRPVTAAARSMHLDQSGTLQRSTSSGAPAARLRSRRTATQRCTMASPLSHASKAPAGGASAHATSTESAAVYSSTLQQKPFRSGSSSSCACCSCASAACWRSFLSSPRRCPFLNAT